MYDAVNYVALPSPTNPEVSYVVLYRSRESGSGEIIDRSIRFILIVAADVELCIAYIITLPGCLPSVLKEGT